MFDNAQFERLYALLSGDMMAGDCGVRCQQYCCRAAEAIKYLLPGEDDYFSRYTPDNFVITDHYIFAGYRGRDGGCACTRALRPFCCRIFPFRPVIDTARRRVTGLRKVTGAGFDEHCWVAEPLPAWRDNAIAAWQLVLGDLDNVTFYARYALFLAAAQARPDAGSSSILSDVGERLSAMDESAVWRAAAALFEMLGHAPSDWPPCG